MLGYELAPELFCQLFIKMADVDQAPVPTPRRRGAPRKYADPVPGVEMTQEQKRAFNKREWARKHYASDPVAVYNHTYELFKKRMAKYKEAMHVVAQIRATVAV